MRVQSPRSQEPLTRFEFLLLLGLLAIGCGLRFYHIGAQSLTYDEGMNLYFSRQPLSNIVPTVVNSGEIHPPLSYILQHVVVRMGTSESCLRSLSAFFGCLLLPLTWWIGRRVGGRQVGLVAVGLSAVSPFSIMESQELRFYMQAAFLFSSGCAVLLAVYDTPNAPRRTALLTLLAVIVTASLYTHYYALFVVAAWWAYTWRCERAQLRDVSLAIGAAALCFAPWMPTFIEQFGRAHGVLRERVRWTELPYGVFHMAFSSSGTLPSAVIIAIAILAAVLAVSGAKRTRRGMLLLYAVALPICCGWLSLLLGMRLYYGTITILFTPIFLILLAAGLLSLPARPRLALVLAMLWGQAVFLYNYEYDAAYANQDNRQVGAMLTALAAPGDLVVLTRSMDVPVFLYYYRGRAAWKAIDLEATPADRLAAAFAPFSSIWLVFYPAVTSPPEKYVPSTFKQVPLYQDGVQVRLFQNHVVNRANLIVVEHFVNVALHP